MTNTQKITIEEIRKAAENMHGHHSDKYEIKLWEVNENEYFVSLAFEVGLKGDEGTMAVFTRDYCHLFIGKRGKITYPVYKNGKSYEKRFKNIYEVSIDQR